MAIGSRKLAHGTKLKMGDGASEEVFATIPYLFLIGLPSTTRAIVDFSDHDTEDFMEFAGARLRDGGTLGLEGHFAPLLPAQAAFLDAVADGTTHNFQIETFDGEWVCSFAAFVTGHGGSAPSESGAGKITFTGELKVAGDVEYAAGA
jgi:hypothetical protein